MNNPQLIKQGIYYIDNIQLIESLEKIVIKHYYNQIFKENPRNQVDKELLWSKYTPMYINYEQYYDELSKRKKFQVVTIWELD